MKNKTIKSSILILLAFTLCIAIASCEEKQEEKIIKPITIKINIDYPDESGLKDIEDKKLKVEEETPAIDALQVFCNANDIPITIETTNLNLLGINGVLNTDEYDNSINSYKNDDKEVYEDGNTIDDNVCNNDNLTGNWYFLYNNKEIKKEHPSEIFLKNDDTITWVYR